MGNDKKLRAQSRVLSTSDCRASRNVWRWGMGLHSLVVALVAMAMPVGSVATAQESESARDGGSARVRQQAVSLQDASQEKTATTQDEQQVMQDRYEALSKALSEVKFVGNFTVTGRDNAGLAKEEYFLLRTDKLDRGDLWTITARIKYGTHDLTVPMTMEIKWAGETPVITVDQLTIPGFGTFDARVLIRDGQYAGTWKHGEVGGHLFGEIQPLTPEELAELKERSGRRRQRGDSDNSDG